MKNFAFLFLLFFVAILTRAQNPNLDYNRAVKIYNLSTFTSDLLFLKDTGRSSIRTTSATDQILHPTIAYQWASKNKNFHEIELTNLMLSGSRNKTEIVNDTSGKVQATIGANNFLTTYISLRYEYILNFNKKHNRKFVPSLGFAIRPYFKQNNNSPSPSNSYGKFETIAGASTYITPRLTYYISPRLFIDINLPLCFSDTYSRTIKNENPAIPSNQRTITYFDLQIFPNQFSGRLGLGLKL